MAPILQVPNRLLPNYPLRPRIRVKQKDPTTTTECLTNKGISLAELSSPPFTYNTKQIRSRILQRNSAVLKNTEILALVKQNTERECRYVLLWKCSIPELKQWRLRNTSQTLIPSRMSSGDLRTSGYLRKVDTISTQDTKVIGVIIRNIKASRLPI